MPEEVAAALALGRLTALLKDSWKVRGIVVGSILRRLVGKALSKDFSKHFMNATAPFQFALQTRVGTDALAQALRLIADGDGDRVILSLDGVGAFDHIRRSAIF